MRFYLTLVVLILAVIVVKCDNKAENGQAVVRSSVKNSAENEKQSKVDAETKEQLEESENDDKTLAKQEKESKDESDADASENTAEQSDEGSAEETSVEEAEDSDKEDEKASGDEDVTTKRAEESKGGKKGKKYLAYPLFYPGDYFGHHHGTGGPSGFNPGSIWEYPYPFVHPMYPSPFYPCACSCKSK